MSNRVRRLLWERENLLATFDLSVDLWARLVRINKRLFSLGYNPW